MMKSRFDDVVVLCFFFQQRVYITGPMIVVERLLNSLKNLFSLVIIELDRIYM